MTGILSSPDLWIDAAGGAAQVALALFLLLTRGRNARSFALFMGANGLAFFLRNLVPHSHPAFPLLGGTIWGSLNWLAAVALVVASTRWPKRPNTTSPAAFVAVTLIALSWLSAPRSVTVLVLGGSAVYAAVAYVLVILLLGTRGATERSLVEAALLTAVLTPNSGLHAGVGLVARTSIYSVAHTVVLLTVAAAWLLRLPRRDVWRPALELAGLVTLLTVVGGVAAVVMLGSQAAVQNAGVYGLGRAAAVLLAAQALGQNWIFAKEEDVLRPRDASYYKKLPSRRRVARRFGG